MMIDRENYRRVEGYLRSYQKNTARLEQLRAELEEIQTGSDIHAQDYSGRLKAVAGGADPVGLYVQRVMSLEHRISVLERYTQPVSDLLEDLRNSPDRASHNLLLILEQHYLAGVAVSRLLEVTGWNRSTFYSRRLSLVSLAVSYFVEEKY